MQTRIFEHFDRLCKEHGAGGVVLEIGSTGTADTLLALPSLSLATRRIGVNLEAQPPLTGIEFVTANANAMPWLADMSIDTVLCNSTLEHDAYFWRTLSEVRRVLKPGGLFVVGVPGYAENRSRRLALKAAIALWPEPLPGATRLRASAASTPALVVHRFPADYYRFGEDALRAVFLEDMESLTLDRLMHPPRFIAAGRRR